MPAPVEVVLIGAGQRGAGAYAPYALRYPERLRFTAVAEPDPLRRERFAALHSIPAERQFAAWEPLLALPRMGQAALICTPDHLHAAPALEALRAGYHALLEKPMAVTPHDCRRLVEASEAAALQLHICHVLRYTRHFETMRQIIQSGELGEVVDVAHRENVSFWHMAHSYVRGNWRDSRAASPMILAKCCHDFDILLWMLGSRCARLSSMGNLLHFRPQNAPPGAPDRCTNDCPAAETCPYEAGWIYRDMIPFWRSFADTSSGFPAWAARVFLDRPGLVRAMASLRPELRQLTDYRGWPLSVLDPDPTPANIERALREGPYGRCVYHCDNNVVDHQVVLMDFESGASVTLTMQGHSHTECRTTRIEGARGRLTAQLGNGGGYITIDDHRSGRKTRYDTSPDERAGHGGGDLALMAAFIDSLQGDASAARTTARVSLSSHLLAFAAERARLDHTVIDTLDLA